MNSKQIKQLKESLPSIFEYSTWTSEQKQIDKEISCREMINSCLIYGTDFLSSKYSNDYIKNLGKPKVLELYREQLEHFNNCIVINNVYEDSEGITYNTLIEPEEDGFINVEIVEEPTFNNVSNTNETLFLIRLKDKWENKFKVGLSSDVSHDYTKYYIGRKIGIKVEKTNLGLYKVTDVDFFENEMELN